MSAPVNRDPRRWVLTLEELTSVYARFVHTSPADGSHAGVEMDLIRAEWEGLGRPASVTVTVSADRR